MCTRSNHAHLALSTTCLTLCYMFVTYQVHAMDEEWRVRSAGCHPNITLANSQFQREFDQDVARRRADREDRMRRFVNEQPTASRGAFLPTESLCSQPKTYAVGDFEREHLKTLALAAKLAYDPAAGTLRENGWYLRSEDVRVQDDLHAYVFTIPRESDQKPLAVLSIRGTVELKTWLLNLAEIGVWGSEANRGLISGIASLTGFDMAAATRKTDINARDRIHSLLTWAKSRKKAYERSHELLVSGHSLGGFLAAVIAVELKINGAGFCAPALGQYDRHTDVPELTASRVRRFKEGGYCFIEWIVKKDVVPHTKHGSYLQIVLHALDTYPD